MRLVLVLFLAALALPGCRSAAFTWSPPAAEPARSPAMPVAAAGPFVEAAMARPPLGAFADAGVAGDAGPE